MNNIDIYWVVEMIRNIDIYYLLILLTYVNEERDPLL